jgi:adenylate cyclase
MAMLLYATGLAHEAELGTVDTRFDLRGEETPRDDIALVLIDDVSLSEIGLRYPFPRSLQAQVIDRVNADDPKVIAEDIEYVGETTLRDDNALFLALDRAGPGMVVLADSRPNEQGQATILLGQQNVDRVGARVGNSQLGEDSDGVRRRMPYEVGNLKTFPIVTAETALGEEITEDELGGESAWIDYAGPPGTYPFVSYSKVLNGEVEPGTFEDKIVVVGAEDPTLKDVGETSTTSADDLMSGPEFEANGIATALEDFPLQSTPLGIDLVLIALMGMVAPFASSRLSPPRALAVAIGAAAVYVAGAQLAFNSGRIVPVVYPLVALGISIVGSLLVYYVLEALERQRVRDTFARFVPADVVGEVLERTDHDLRLGGRSMVVTVLFSDIRGFTTFSETREPKEVIEILNRYHEEMTAAVMEHGGTLISFIGDGIMAVFGAPIEQRDHADRALASAREMLEVRLPRFNEWMRERDVGEEFQIGVGLNSGPVMAGNVGSEQRMEYTTIGDTVNTAARLEGMTKGTPHSLFLAGSTRELLRSDDGLAYVDSMPVRGRAQPLEVWAPAPEGAPAPAEEASPAARSTSGPAPGESSSSS